MRIGQFAKKFGLDTRTIDFYTKTHGLLEPKLIPGSGYRDYDEECEKTLLKILIFRDIGLSINEIKDALKDPSYFTREKLDAHIAQMEEHRDVEIKRYNEMIDFAKTMRDTSMAPLRIIQLNDDSTLISMFSKAFSACIHWTGDIREFFNADDIDELLDLLVALVSNLHRYRAYGPDSSEVQQILTRSFSRLRKYTPAVLAISLSFIADSEEDFMGLEKKCNEEEYNFYKSILKFCADWYKAARTSERITDYSLFKELFADQVRELDAQYRKIDDSCGVSVIEDAFSLVCVIYESMSSSANNIWEVNLLISYTAQLDLDAEYGEGFTKYIDEALKKYVCNKKEIVDTD